jgi:hypothetical protein
VRWVVRFLVTAVLLGASFAALFQLGMTLLGFPTPLGAAVAVGLAYGGSMAALFTGATWFSSRRRGGDAAAAVRQRRRAVIPLPRAAALRLCAESVGRLPKGRVKRVDEGQGVVEAENGFTWKSFGESIRFTVLGGDESVQLVEVESRPSLRTTLVDYGRNHDNVVALVSHLVEHGATVEDAPLGYPASEF